MAKDLVLDLGEEEYLDEYIEIDWESIFDTDVVDISPEDLNEVINCSASARYFIDNFCWIEQKETRTIMPFKLYPYQAEILERLLRGESIVILKSRRVGISWVIAAYVAWLLLFRDGVNVLFLSRTEKDAKRLLAKVKFIVKNLAYHDTSDIATATPATFLASTIETDNASTFSTGFYDDEGNLASTSEVISLTTTDDAGRSEGASFIFWDEAAFGNADSEAIMGSIMPTTLRGGHFVIASTPGDAHGAFWMLVRDGQRGDNTAYHYMEVHWSEAGITQDQVDRIRSIMRMSEDTYLQEFELQFIQAGDPVFGRKFLDAAYMPLDDFPEVLLDLQAYDEEVGVYYSGADTAKGQRKKGLPDYNAFVSITSSGIVACSHFDRNGISLWAGKLHYHDDGEMRWSHGTVYNLHGDFPGILYIEDNGPGLTLLQNYKNPEGKKVECLFQRFQTTSLSKPRIINQLILAFESGQLTITNKEMYNQLYDYRKGRKIGSYEAAPGGNDDLVDALALAYDAFLKHGQSIKAEALPMPTKTRSITKFVVPRTNAIFDDGVGFGTGKLDLPTKFDKSRLRPKPKRITRNVR